MDVFKLLTRSTSLSRQALKPSKHQHAPSEGAASNPQLFGSAKRIGIVNGDNKKRKREENNSTELAELPKELNFFGGHTSTTAKVNGNSGNTKDLAQEHKAVDRPKQRSVVPSVDAEEVLEEEACRRVLKEHKIKITELWASSTPIVEEIIQGTEKKKRKRAKEQTLSEGTSKKNKKRKLDIVPQPLTSFAQLRLRYDMSEKLLDNIVAQGYNIPTEVQLGSLPLLCDAQPGSGVADVAVSSMHGPNLDLLAVAPTGSGKTLAFLIPVLNAIMQTERIQHAGGHLQGKRHAYAGVQAIIVAPTKELASQIANEGRKLALNTGIKVTLVRKGMEIGKPDTADEQVEDDEEHLSEAEDDGETASKPGKQPATKAHILVSTPLTLVHAISNAKQAAISLSSVRYLVLDEADVLLDPLFREQTLKIWTACSNHNLRISLWSATMGASIEALAVSVIEKRNNEVHQDGAEPTLRHRLVRLVVGLKDSAIPNVQHKLLYAGNEQGKLMALRQLLRPSTSSADMPSIRPPFLVFTQTIPRAIALHSELLYDIPQEAGGSARIAVLHSDLSDTARERVMTQVRKGEIWVLITTDLLSRGVDFKGINGVVNYDFPNSSAIYVHRVGRTGRAGREGGVAVTLYSKEDIPFVKNVANVIAASEKQGNITNEETEARQRLLDNLPKPSKRDKQQLKQRGVESRRSGKDQKGATRISTKSGYQRKLENNRKSATKRGGDAQAVTANGVEKSGSDDGFSGFDD